MRNARKALPREELPLTENAEVVDSIRGQIPTSLTLAVHNVEFRQTSEAVIVQVHVKSPEIRENPNNPRTIKEDKFETVRSIQTPEMSKRVQSS